MWGTLIGVSVILFIFVGVIEFASTPYTMHRISVEDMDLLSTKLHYETPPFAITEFALRESAMAFTHLVEKLQTANVTFWLVKSSLLGFARHGGRVPWCPRFEIAVLHADLARLVALRADVEHSGLYQLHSTSRGYVLFRRREFGLPSIAFVHIDIMKETDIEVALCTPLDELSQCSFEDSYRYRREVFRTESVFPLAGPSAFQVAPDIVLYVRTPNQPDKCLSTLYGPDWTTTVAQSPWVHVTGSHTIWRRLF